MKLDWTYKYLDWLPQIPDELLDHVIDGSTIISTDVKNLNSQKRHWTRNGQVRDSVDYHGYQIQRQDLMNWLDQNIIKECVDKRFTATAGTSSHHWPHVDYTRSYTLNYILDTGGDNVITSFYIEPGFPMLRPDVVPQPSGSMINHDKLEVIDSVQFVPRRWHILNAKCIHGVENLKSPRVMVQISLNDASKFV